MSDFNTRLNEAFAHHQVFPDKLAIEFYRTIAEAGEDDLEEAGEFKLDSGSQPVYSKYKKWLDEQGPDRIWAFINASVKKYLGERKPSDAQVRSIVHAWIALYNFFSDYPKLTKSHKDETAIALKLAARALVGIVARIPETSIPKLEKSLKTMIDRFNIRTNPGEPPLTLQPQVLDPGEEEPFSADEPEEPTPAPPPEQLSPEEGSKVLDQEIKGKSDLETAGGRQIEEPGDVEILKQKGGKVMARIMGKDARGQKATKYLVLDGPSLQKITGSEELSAWNVHDYIHKLNDDYQAFKTRYKNEPQKLQKIAANYKSRYLSDNVAAHDKMEGQPPRAADLEGHLKQMLGDGPKDGTVKALRRILKGGSITGLTQKNDPIKAHTGMAYLMSANDEVINQLLHKFRPTLEKVSMDTILDRLRQDFSPTESKINDSEVLNEVFGAVKRWYRDMKRNITPDDVKIAKRLWLYERIARYILNDPSDFAENYLKPAGLGTKYLSQIQKPKQMQKMDSGLPEDQWSRARHEEELRHGADAAKDVMDRIKNHPESVETSETAGKAAGKLEELIAEITNHDDAGILRNAIGNHSHPAFEMFQSVWNRNPDELYRIVQKDPKKWLDCAMEVEKLAQTLPRD